jgi:hypothetical protein
MSIPHVLTRSLTHHKYIYASSVLDELHSITPGSLFPGKKILLEMGIAVDHNTDFLNDDQTEFTWRVHYIYMRINDTKEFCQEHIYGTKQYVYSLFSHELL